ncbi:uncharacterized protein MYCFIDRAFT_170826 [Pseudocercospora fijiensis CIRAD86]|uniref:Uncharacterized protein n=1 Tax=Pseudocercospora fijiensis (strain CIRAD86) TaxID=383855 RepID=N1QBC0_PSEFD|nr:uncharacterized protein MYCFIDRAFT_170826 [Pseudocercospora fijiensis CIRAD86]EME89371.1 hypothetical protein MYCFIDRAFT_170826 [Pseudocercospora fijiensis CIRAD86]
MRSPCEEMFAVVSHATEMQLLVVMRLRVGLHVSYGGRGHKATTMTQRLVIG